MNTFSPVNVANEPRAAVTASHKTAGRVGSICVLGGHSHCRGSTEGGPRKANPR